MSLEKNTLEFLKAIISSHATFNALSAIQNYIVSDEKRGALVSLSGFAKFVRKMSNTASTEEIEIAEDIAFVKAYLDMELLRFGDDIAFEINIDEEVLDSLGKIPSFIIQPTLEKMLLMGLKSGSRDFTLSVNVEISDTHLTANIGLDKPLESAVLEEFSPEQANRINLLDERLTLLDKKIKIKEGNVNSKYSAIIEIPLN